MGKKTPKSTMYSVDQVMLEMSAYLVRDFQSNLGDPLFCNDFRSAAISKDVERLRDPIPAAPDASIAEFKAIYQLQSLNKRYRYQHDIYSNQQLQDKTLMSFLSTIERNSCFDFNFAPESFMGTILSFARLYISQTLGSYCDVEHRTLCRFGRKAAVGITAAKACEAERWELPLSGSKQQISWFDSEMSHVECVQDYWQAQMNTDPAKRSIYKETSSLKLTLVPKTFKSLRCIMPNTNIGSYMSHGLGEMIRKRLKGRGYDIRRLQHIHRDMARTASLHKNYVTADLSHASDSISVALVEALFPSDWFDILVKSRIELVTLPNGRIISSNIFGTMGIGYTFPLQTLVFLSILKAIEATMYNRWNRKVISVYGDDMIYSSCLHNNVVTVFENLGFVINLDKTFHEGDFRESCGGDYYRGVDVRPFQPRDGAAFVGSKTYEAMLYKCINGLLRRWDEHEVTRALSFLCSQVESVSGKIKIVPADHPDDSGVRCPSLGHWSFLQCCNVVKPKYIGHGLYRFPYLRFKPQLRKEVRHEPYLWARLRGHDRPDSHEFGLHDTRLRCADRTLVDYARDRRCHTAWIPFPYSVIDVVPLLIPREVEPPSMVRSKLTGHRYRRIEDCVTISHTGHYSRQSGLSCF